MAGSVNKVILVGNLGRDPEIRTTQSGERVATLTLATSETWNDRQSGERKERTEWHRIVVWGKLGELCGEYLAKGRPVFIEGRLKLDTWQDKTDGSNRSKLKVVVESFQFIDSRAGAEGGGGGGPPNAGNGAGRPPAQRAPAPGAPDRPAPAGQPQGAEIQEEDIPF